MNTPFTPYKMKTLIPLLVALLIGFAACTPKEETLDEKKARLGEMLGEIDVLKADAKKLQDEINKLDPSKAGILKPRMVKVADLQTQVFENFIEVQGIIESDQNVLANPAIPGMVTSINVTEGQTVTKGQILASTDNMAMQKGILELENGLDFATIAYEKQKRLWDQKIGSELQYLSAKNQKESLEKKLVTLRSQLDMTYIKSPINGIVDQVNIKVGEMASPPFAGIRIVNLNDIKLTGKLTDNYISKVRRGQKVTVRFPDLNKDVTASVSYVGNTIGPNRQFEVEVKLNNPGGEIKPNMLANLLIEDQKIADALVVPSNTIERTASGNYIFVAATEGGKPVARRRPVQTGADYNGQTVITGGLSAGDKIITFGFQDVVDGQPLIIEQ